MSTAEPPQDAERFAVYDRSARAADMLTSFDEARFSVSVLQTYARGDDPPLRSGAADLLARLVDETAPPRYRDAESLGPMGPTVGRAWRWIDTRADRIYQRFTAPTSVPAGARWGASTLWLAFALTAALLIAAGHWWSALWFVLARIIGSMFLSTAVFPDEHGLHHKDDESTRSQVERCLMSHLGDVVILFGVAAALSAHQRVVFAMSTTAAATLMVFSSLARVDAFQSGAYIHRRIAERIARRATVVLALVLAGALQPEVPERGIPVLAIACIGGAAYALVELSRVHRVLGEGNGVIIVQRPRNAAPRVIHDRPTTSHRGTPEPCSPQVVCGDSV